MCVRIHKTFSTFFFKFSTPLLSGDKYENYVLVHHLYQDINKKWIYIKSFQILKIVLNEHEIVLLLKFIPDMFKILKITLVPINKLIT